MNSGDKKEKVPKPARIPPQTPPAGGKSAEAGRIHIPSQLFRPAESILVLLKKSSCKVYNYSTIGIEQRATIHRRFFPLAVVGFHNSFTRVIMY